MEIDKVFYQIVTREFSMALLSLLVNSKLLMELKGPPITSDYVTLHGKRELTLQTNFSLLISFEYVIRDFTTLSRPHSVNRP